VPPPGFGVIFLIRFCRRSVWSRLLVDIFFLSPPGSLRSVRRASSTTVFPLIVFDQEHAGRVRFGRWSPVRFWVVTAQDRTEIFQRLFGLHAIDFSLPVLAFCRRAWSRR
jgi:hypothetical protein